MATLQTAFDDTQRVSDNGASAPISALTSAISLGSFRAKLTDEIWRFFVARAVRLTGHNSVFEPRTGLGEAAPNQHQNESELRVGQDPVKRARKKASCYEDALGGPPNYSLRIFSIGSSPLKDARIL